MQKQWSYGFCFLILVSLYVTTDAFTRITESSSDEGIYLFIYYLPKTHDFMRADNNNDNQRTNGPVNAHLISWPSKAQNKQYSHNFIISISCLHLPTFRSQAAIVSEKSTFFTFSHRKA